MALASSVVATGGLSFAMSLASHPSVGGTVSGTTVSGTPNAAAGAGSATTPTTAAAAGSGAATPTTAAPTSGAYADGTYTGSEDVNRYGPVEVQITVSGGKVTAVSLVEQPSDGKSQRINSQAAPILEQEAVAAQSSTLDVVSGATYTSQSYATSLQSALDQASGGATSSTATPISTSPS